MNALELADALEIAKNKLIGKEYELGGKAIIIYTEAATMLRQFGLAESIIKQQQLEIEALKNNLDFIVGINRLGLGVQKEGGLSSEKIEKIWLSIEEQRDDNFHYGWKKCEQYYGIRKAQEQ